MPPTDPPLFRPAGQKGGSVEVKYPDRSVYQSATLDSTVEVKKKLYIENVVYLRAPWELDDVLRTQYISVLPEYEV